MVDSSSMAEACAVSVREMRPEDFDRVVRLWGEAGLPHRPQGRDSRSRVITELGTPMSLFLVAEAGGELIGSLLGTTDGRKGWVNRLAVHPAWWRRGVALALLEEFERRCQAREILVVAALVQDDNPSSKQLFRKAGYQEDRAVVYYSKRRSDDA